MRYLKKYKFKFRCLTPIHIGGGEKINIFDYKVEPGSQVDNQPPSLYNYTLCVLDHAKIYSSLSETEKQKILKLSRSDSYSDITALRNMIAEKAFKKEHYFYKINAHKAFYDDYKNKINEIKNQVELSLFARNGFQPYIPGSSIKGAIRTGIINALLKSKTDYEVNEIKNFIKNSYKGHDKKNISRDVEFKVMEALDNFGKNSIEKDLLGGISVSDIMIKNSQIFACKLTKYVSKEKLKELHTLDHMEINCELTQARDLNLEIVVNVHPDIKHNINTKISSIDLLEYLNCLNSYNVNKLVAEMDRLFPKDFKIVSKNASAKYEISDIRNAYIKIHNEVTKKDEKQKFLVRIGFSSGYDFNTLDRVRKFEKPLHRKMGNGWGYSANLFGKNPLGFALLELESIE